MLLQGHPHLVYRAKQRKHYDGPLLLEKYQLKEKPYIQRYTHSKSWRNWSIIQKLWFCISWWFSHSNYARLILKNHPSFDLTLQRLNCLDEENKVLVKHLCFPVVFTKKSLWEWKILIGSCFCKSRISTRFRKSKLIEKLACKCIIIYLNGMSIFELQFKRQRGYVFREKFSILTYDIIRGLTVHFFRVFIPYNWFFMYLSIRTVSYLETKYDGRRICTACCLIEVDKSCFPKNIGDQFWVEMITIYM